MSISYVPSSADAPLWNGPSQITFFDPRDYGAPDPTFVDAKHFFKPIQDQYLRTGRTAPARPEFAVTYACSSGLSVGDPVYVSGTGTMAKANSTNGTKSKVVGWVGWKPTPTTCNIYTFAYAGSVAAGTAGNPVYLQDDSSYGPSSGSVEKVVGTYATSTTAILQAGPTKGQISGSSGFSGGYGPSGYAGPNAPVDSGVSGISGYNASHFPDIYRQPTTIQTDNTWPMYELTLVSPQVLQPGETYAFRFTLNFWAFNSNGVRIGVDGPAYDNFFWSYRIGSTFWDSGVDGFFTAMDYEGSYVDWTPSTSSTTYMMADGTIECDSMGSPSNLYVGFNSITGVGGVGPFLDETSYLEVTQIS